MALTTTAASTPLSPPKKRRNQELFFVMLCGAVDLGKWKSGKQRENAGIDRDFLRTWNRAFADAFPAFPPVFPMGLQIPTHFPVL
jgi:hypothetical protein